jgi:topoisomerase IV subunit B
LKTVRVDDLTSLRQDTTHDWAIAVDADHLAHIRRDPATFAPGGVQHLVLEVVAYAADEAKASNGGQCVVTFCRDGSVSVSDDGRGTATRRDARGRVVKKPVMSTKDLRFFDSPGAQLLPDGHPRRGISVVAALSEWLVHANRRRDGAWTQRYERGMPVTALVPIPCSGMTGTTVHFRPDETVRASGAHAVIDAVRLAAWWQELSVEIRHEVIGAARLVPGCALGDVSHLPALPGQYSPSSPFHTRLRDCHVSTPFETLALSQISGSVAYNGKVTLRSWAGDRWGTSYPGPFGGS